MDILKTKRIDISLNLLRLIAMFLIINSHSDVLYPSKFRFIASGGAIGNGLFFMLSGYFFKSKIDKKMDYLLNRFLRLFLPAWIMIIISLIFGEIKINGVTDAIRLLIWPTRFWFVGAILVFYILMCLILQKYEVEDKKRFFILSMIIVILNILAWIFLVPDKNKWVIENVRIFKIIPYKIIYCFFEFCLGYYLKMNSNKIKHKIKIYLVLSGMTLIGFYGFKFLLNKGIVSMKMQIISQPLTVLCCFFLLQSFMRIDLNSVLQNKKLGNVINNLSGLSLETYVVQFVVIAFVNSLHLKFPLNCFVCYIMVFVFAWILHSIDKRILDSAFHIGTRHHMH